MSRYLRPVYGHAAEGRPETWEGTFDTVDEATADGLKTYAKGTSFYVVEGRWVAPKDLVDADDVVDLMEQQADDNGAPDGWDGLQVDAAAKVRLDLLLGAWASSISPTYWLAEGDPVRVENA